mgnify:CR=1 FL=1
MNAHWIILCFPLQRKSRENEHWAWRSERYFLSKSSHNRIHIYSGCFGATDDLPTTFLYLSLLLHFVRLSLSSSYDSFLLFYWWTRPEHITSWWINSILLDLHWMKYNVWMLTESFFVFLCKENQERTNFKLGEVEGIFYENPIIIVLILTVTVLVPQMTWPHSYIFLCYCTLLGCHWAPVSFYWSKVCCFVDEQDRSTALAVGLIGFF